MVYNQDIKKIYGILVKIVLGVLFFMTSSYISNETYNLIFLIFAFSLIGLTFLDVLIFYFFEVKKNFKKNKIRNIFLSVFLLIFILSFILYLLIGLVPGFYIAVFGGLVSYIISLSVVIGNSKSKSKKKIK